jgi:hypothetical protein
MKVPTLITMQVYLDIRLKFQEPILPGEGHLSGVRGAQHWLTSDLSVVAWYMKSVRAVLVQRSWS